MAGVTRGFRVELNRNQWFFLGAIILLMGVQLRMVSVYVLTEDATRFLAERLHSSTDAEQSVIELSADLGDLKKEIHPPEWLGWCIISVGAVLILHSLAMPRPSS